MRLVPFTYNNETFMVNPDNITFVKQGHDDKYCTIYFAASESKYPAMINVDGSGREVATALVGPSKRAGD
jgi:hypothetical protein